MRRFFALSILVLSMASPSFAWHDGGHKTVAAIAFRQLSASEKSAVFELIKRHPRFAEEFTAKMPSGLNDDQKIEWSFQQAAVFPDIARTYDEPLKSQYHHGEWHYINAPLFLTARDRMAMRPEQHLNLDMTIPTTLASNSNVIQVIKTARKSIADENLDASQRALMLSWLFHTVGDIHQPLHSTAMFSHELFPKGDRGGNSVNTKQKGNLHSLWDDFPGGRLSFPRVQQEALELIGNSSLLAIGKRAATELDESQWFKESKDLAVHVVYGAEVLGVLRNMEREHADLEHQPIDLSDDYLRTGSKVCDQRIIQAGFRLGAILSGLFD